MTHVDCVEEKYQTECVIRMALEVVCKLLHQLKKGRIILVVHQRIRQPAPINSVSIPEKCAVRHIRRHWRIRKMFVFDRVPRFRKHNTHD